MDDMRLLVGDFCPQVVVIDGIVEFVASFNDEAMAKQLIHELLCLSEEHRLSIVCVLHTNKADDDHNMRGHLGTMLAQKAGTVLECKKMDGVITVSCSDARHQEMPDWSIMFQDDGCIADADEQRRKALEQHKAELQQRRQEANAQKQKERLDYALSCIRDNGGSMSRKQLTAILISKYNYQRQTVSAIISQWLKDGKMMQINGYLHASEETALAYKCNPKSKKSAYRIIKNNKRNYEYRLSISIRVKAADGPPAREADLSALRKEKVPGALRRYTQQFPLCGRQRGQVRPPALVRIPLQTQ